MKRRSAFTLIEQLMVVAIIAILIALLLPAIQSAREMARRVQCTNNLLQLGIALGNYASAHRVLPPGVVNATGPIHNLPQGYHVSWTVQILPFFEKGAIYRAFDFREGVYAPSNETARDVRIQTFLCPSSRVGTMAYGGCHHDVEAPIAADNHGLLYLNSRVAYDDITDGPACTILLGEIAHGSMSLGWASGTRASLRNTGSRINKPEEYANPRGVSGSAISPGHSKQADLDAVAVLVEDGILPIDFVGGFSSFHPSGANFLFGDGSVRYLKESISKDVFRLLGNRADGELISDDSF